MFRESCAVSPLHTIYRPQRSWGKVIFSQACVILFTGGCLVPGGLVPGGPGLGVHGPGSAWSRGYLVPGGVSGPGGAWWRPPRDSYCCGQYASYWNAFLFFLGFGGNHSNFRLGASFWRMRNLWWKLDYPKMSIDHPLQFHRNISVMKWSWYRYASLHCRNKKNLPNSISFFKTFKFSFTVSESDWEAICWTNIV